MPLSCWQTTRANKNNIVIEIRKVSALAKTEASHQQSIEPIIEIFLIAFLAAIKRKSNTVE
jgi:hypothetical protein